MSTAWWEQGFAVLDTETTSPNPEEAQVASICLGYIDIGAKSKELRNGLVQVEMPEAAGAVNGLSTDRLMAEGKPAADVLDEFCAEATAFLVLGKPLVIQNAAYDLTVLDRDCRRNGVPTISDRLGGGVLAPIVDPGVLDKKVEKFRRRVSPTQGARCLKTLAQVHGIGWDDDLAHTAEYDALQAGRVAWALMRHYPQLARMTLAELHEAQVGWHAEQSESLAQFFRRGANDSKHLASATEDDAEQAAHLEDERVLREKADSVNTEWPLRTSGGAA